MAYFICHVVSESGPPTDGPDIASTRGWADWGSWVLDRHEEFTESAHLAEHGFLEGDESLADLEHELETIAHEIGNPDLAAVTSELLAAVRGRPKGTLAVLVTDGEPGDEDDEE
jgi:hypothetical protein